MKDDEVFKAAFELVKALHKATDSELPKKIADIVKLHAGIAVGAAILPVPGADIVGAAANIWTMYFRINSALELRFDENVIKTIATGFATNLGAAVAGTLVVGTALKFVPGLGSVGGAVVIAATIYGLTLASGILYLKLLAALTDADGRVSGDAAAMRNTAEQMFGDRGALKRMVQRLKEGYKDFKG